jgi:hypothetical protein
MILLLIVLLTTPVDALLQRARCTAQHRIAALVDRCTQLHAPDFKPAAPALQSDRARVGWTPASLAIDVIRGGIDTDVLADTLGAPMLIDGWLRYPLAIDAPGGRCAISALPSGAARTIRFAMTLGRGVRPTVDARCPTSVDLDLLVASSVVLSAYSHALEADRLGPSRSTLPTDWARARVIAGSICIRRRSRPPVVAVRQRRASSRAI